MHSFAALASSVLRQAGPAGLRAFSTTSATQDALKFAVVGSGPAGFYTADKLLKRFADAQVDILDALPVPFGLVRFGVAPDHQDTKNVTNQFTEIARDPRVTFFGNVRVGSPGVTPAAALSLPELRSLYSAVVLACGAESDRRLGVPGEDLPGVFPARRFVQWYNGHPTATDLPLPPLDSVTSVAVCGLGNVALDIARVLLQPADRLAASDATAAAVAALRHSAVREVHLLGRRGPAQAAFTPKELRELVSMEGIALKVHPEGCLTALSPACAAELKSSRINRRVVEVLTKAEAENKPGDRTLHLHFLRTPAEFLKNDAGTGVAAVRLEEMALQPGSTPGAAQRAVGTGKYENLPAQLVLESIGYRSVAVEGAPFDARSGTVPNVLGQVIDPEDGGNPVTGLFVCGWLKRGPSGIIGTNLVDAEQTVDTLARAAAEGGFSGGDVEGREGLKALLDQRGVEVVGFEGWEAIDAAERAAGAAAGKPREKITDVAEMLAIARKTT